MHSCSFTLRVSCYFWIQGVYKIWSHLRWVPRNKVKNKVWLSWVRKCYVSQLEPGEYCKQLHKIPLSCIFNKIVFTSENGWSITLKFWIRLTYVKVCFEKTRIFTNLSFEDGGSKIKSLKHFLEFSKCPMAILYYFISIKYSFNSNKEV